MIATSTVRKVLPALYAPGAHACPRRAGRDPHTMGIAEMVQSLQGCAPVKQSLTRAGVLRATAMLLEQNDIEIRKLTRTGAPS